MSRITEEPRGHQVLCAPGHGAMLRAAQKDLLLKGRNSAAAPASNSSAEQHGLIVPCCLSRARSPLCGAGAGTGSGAPG